MSPPSFKNRFEQTVNALNEALAELYLLTQGLTLLESLNELAVETAQAIEVLLEDVEQADTSELNNLLSDSDVWVLLDAFQGANPLDDLKRVLLEMADVTTNPNVIVFMTELIEKITLKYNHLLDAAHAFKALVSRND